LTFDEFYSELKLIINESDDSLDALLPGATRRAIQKIEQRHAFRYMRFNRRFVLGDDRRAYRSQGSGIVTPIVATDSVRINDNTVDFVKLGFKNQESVTILGSGWFAPANKIVGKTGTLYFVATNEVFILFPSDTFTGGEANIASSISLNHGFATNVYDLGAFLLPAGTKKVEEVKLFDPTNSQVFVNSMDQLDEVDFDPSELSNVLTGGDDYQPRGYILAGQVGKIQPFGISLSDLDSEVGLMRPAPSARYNVTVSGWARTGLFVHEDTHWLLNNCEDLVKYGTILDLGISLRDRELRAEAQSGYNGALMAAIADDLELDSSDRSESFQYTSPFGNISRAKDKQ
jgi:hypothetical protein